MSNFDLSLIKLFGASTVFVVTFLVVYLTDPLGVPVASVVETVVVLPIKELATVPQSSFTAGTLLASIVFMYTISLVYSLVTLIKVENNNYDLDLLNKSSSKTIAEQTSTVKFTKKEIDSSILDQNFFSFEKYSDVLWNINMNPNNKEFIPNLVNTTYLDIKEMFLKFIFYYSDNYLGLYFELLLILLFCFLIVFLVIIDYVYQYKAILINITYNLFIFIFLLSLIILNNVSSNFYIFNFLIINDDLGLFVKNILVFTLVICISISYFYIKFEKIIHYEYFILLSLSFIGLLTICSANDLTTLYLGIELQSLAFYLLAGFKIYSNFSTEAGLKYFILGAFSSGLLLFGCSLIYGFTGTTNFSEIQLLFFDNKIPFNIFNGILLGNIFITVGILFKLGAAPFHMWLPDVYDGSPTSVMTIFAIVPKIAIFILFLRLTLNLFSNTFFFWHQILIYSAIISIIIGTLGGLYQIKIKKLLAYSAINHIGFLLIGFSSYNVIGIFSLFFYIIVYIIISLNIFSILLSLRRVDNNLKFKKISEFILLFKSNHIIAIVFCIILFSIAGLPPLVGFYSKLYIFISAIKSEIYLITLIAAIFSVIASLYYIRLIKLMFFKRFNYWLLLYEIPKLNSIIISLTFFFNIVFFFYPEIFTIYIYNNILDFFVK